MEEIWKEAFQLAALRGAGGRTDARDGDAAGKGGGEL